ncbi:C4-dicarboxylate TRAP transporter substrate-binding protein [Albimonas sp. CAU 1670]|uniref:C4-dicarboxylate TRAP transporter substrate-binding protein n=1 Tax=Albimonas sp. CAU 1670 TaxID=3032599 RepID=UPI0023DBFC52|nr:C4-dicarboxylate TRAP transporter substrate-binding protein [Albimonas sp. CAU 1670]MDF2232244.1 C4-dicarboxylate TRAP transporter substrate-binding protein [Albimonas sp. CAU 1670]
MSHAARPLAALRTTLLASVSAAALSLPAAAEETIPLTIVAGHAPVAMGVALLRDHFIPEVDRILAQTGDYRIEWTQAYAGSVADYNGVLEAVEDGIADLGYVPHLFEADKLPLEQITYITPFGTADLPKLMKVIEKLHEELPELDQAWADHNQMVLAPVGIDAYHLLTKFPVETLADMDGHKIGTAGLALNWLKGGEAIPVALALPTFYNSMSTGLIDGIMTFETAVTPYKFYEVAPYITKVNFGAQYGSALTINLDVWETLPDPVKDAITEASQSYMDVVAEAYYTSGAKSLEAAAAAGATVSEFPDEQRKAYAEKMPNVAMEWAKALDAKGVSGTKTLEAYMRLSREAGIEHARDWSKE